MADLPVQKGTEHNADVAKVRKIKLQSLTADPADAEDGEIWYDATAGVLRGKIDGAVGDITHTPD